MFRRPFWEARLEAAWRRRSVVWLMGVRRAGKTRLVQSLPDVEYFDCERPSVRQLVEDPEAFLRGRRGRRIALDEIHRLPDPAELLKIAADHFPAVKVIATGSSTLGASARFRDTLTGRKEEVWLTPMVWADLAAFEHADLQHRLHRGGLPPFFLAEARPENEFQEWMDAYWAKDILELFRLERRHAFQRLFELLMGQSGGIFEANPLARACEISRQTVSNYAAVLDATLVMHLVRPFSSGGTAEIITAPKVYGFDSGFVAYYRGWETLRREDLGLLLEHFVLNELHVHVGRGAVRYWRSKSGPEVDFVIPGRGKAVMAIECKWSAGAFDSSALTAFRARYPHGRNVLVASTIGEPFTRRFGDLEVEVMSPTHIADRIGRARVAPQ